MQLKTVWLFLGIVGLPMTFASEASAQLVRRLQGTIRLSAVDTFDNLASTTAMELIEDATNEIIAFTKPSFARMGDQLGNGDWIELTATQDAPNKAFTITRLHKHRRQQLISPSSKRHHLAGIPQASVPRRPTAIYVLLDMGEARASRQHPPEEISQVMDKVASEYTKVSFGKLKFDHDANGDQANDIYIAEIEPLKGVCEHTNWAQEAVSVLQAQGVDMSLYQHQVFLLPREANCGWVGRALVDCGSLCQAWIYAPSSVQVIAHELGHNLGMDHSSTDGNDDGIGESEYGDHSCVMGNDAFHNKGLNAPHSVYMGWTEPEKVSPLTGPGQHKLSPLHLPAGQAQHPQVLTFTTNKRHYFLSYRQSAMADAGLGRQYTTGVSVHSFAGGTAKTLHLATLQSGVTFRVGDYRIMQRLANQEHVAFAITKG